MLIADASNISVSLHMASKRIADFVMLDTLLQGDRRLSKLFTWATRNPTERRTLKMAAQVAGLESTYFSRYFREVTGTTFHRWDGSLRLARAKDLLLSSRLKISAIAEAVGYGDITTMERNFRKYEGISPSEWRALSGVKNRR